MFRTLSLAAILMVVLAAPAFADKVATLERFTGTVEVKATAAAGWIPAVANMSLDREAIVKAGANGTAHIVTLSGRAFDMRPNSSIAVKVLLVTLPASQQLDVIRQNLARDTSTVGRVVGAAGVRGAEVAEARMNQFLVWEEQVTDEDRTVQTEYNAGISLLKAGLVDEALQQFTAIVTDRKTSSYVDDAAYMIANIYEKDLKALDVAWYQYRQFVELYPRSQFRFAADRAIERLASSAPAPAAAPAAATPAPAQ